MKKRWPSSTKCSSFRKSTELWWRTGWSSGFSASPGAGRSGIEYRRGTRIFCLPDRPRDPIEPPYKRHRVFNGVKRTKRDADHSPPSSAELRLGWSYISASCLVMSRHFMGWPLPLKAKLTLHLKRVLNFFYLKMTERTSKIVLRFYFIYPFIYVFGKRALDVKQTFCFTLRLLFKIISFSKTCREQRELRCSHTGRGLRSFKEKHPEACRASRRSIQRPVELRREASRGL